MAQQEPRMPTTCERCGEPFNTSRQHPRQYCSIACEEGRSPLPINDPQSDGYHLHLQGDPEALVGKCLMGVGLKLCDYSPDWHRKPDNVPSHELVDVDRDAQTFIRKDTVIVGNVVDYEDGMYVIRLKKTTPESPTETVIKRHPDSVVVDLIRRDRWWAE